MNENKTVEVVRIMPKRFVKGDPKSQRCSGRWGIKVNNAIVAQDITSSKKAERRAAGLRTRYYVDCESNKKGPIMDHSGRCLTYEERGL